MFLNDDQVVCDIYHQGVYGGGAGFHRNRFQQGEPPHLIEISQLISLKKRPRTVWWLLGEPTQSDGWGLFCGWPWALSWLCSGWNIRIFVQTWYLSNKLTTFRDKICGYDYAKLYCFKRMQEGKSKKGWCWKTNSQEDFEDFVKFTWKSICLF